MPRKLDGSYIQTGSITTTQLSSQVTQVIEAGGGPRVTSLVYPGDDTAANTVGGQTVYIVGSGFETNNAIYINGSAVPAKSFISASNLSFTTPALSEGIYPVYVINTDTGATAIFVPGLTVSNEPTWISSAAIDAGETWEISLSASGDGQITYALANGSSLPGGISLAANGLISGTLTSPPETDTQYTFTVVASDAQNQDSSRQFTVTVSTGEGLLFANNVLLIHADGTNNQNNHTFLDSSSNGFTISRNGNATQGSFSPFSQTGWSAYFDGSGDYLTIPYTSANFDWWTSDFTLEAWVYPTNLSTWQYLDGSSEINPSMIGNADHASAVNYWSFGPIANGTVRFKYFNGASVFVTSTATVNLNAWNHIALTKTSSGIIVWVNGVGTTISAVSGTPQSSASYNLVIGQINNTSIAGYVSNLRIIKGTALYTNNFTPPTSALTAVSNTTLLTLQSNRYVDNSNNNLAITRNGSTQIVPLSPFAPTAAYTTANVGGSLYLDGSGDYLTLPAGSAFAPGTGDFTIEAWVYPTTTSGDQFIWAQTVSGINYFVFAHSGTTAGLTMTPSGGGTSINGPANALKPFSWNHIAAVRISGTVTVYVNGVGGTGTSNTIDLNNTSFVPTIGRYTHDTFGSLTGYISSLRYVKGTGLYTTNFTPPTAPPTNVANTSALLNFTNAGIFDQTAKNVLECVGDAKVSTSVYKYGSGSIAFDGTGDYLKIPSTPAFNLSTGDWTIECWINLSVLTAEARIWSLGTFGSNPEVALLIGGGGAGGSSNDLQLNYLGNSSLITASNVNSTGVWAHVAVVRSSGTTTLYVNGVSKGTTATNPWTSSSTSFWIGGWSQNNNQMNGYIDDLRITKGYARYTSNFTPPASALKDK